MFDILRCIPELKREAYHFYSIRSISVVQTLHLHSLRPTSLASIPTIKQPVKNERHSDGVFGESLLPGDDIYYITDIVHCLPTRLLNVSWWSNVLVFGSFSSSFSFSYFDFVFNQFILGFIFEPNRIIKQLIQTARLKSNSFITFLFFFEQLVNIIHVNLFIIRCTIMFEISV